MSIEFTNSREFIGVWFAPFPGGDFMAAIFRERAELKWHLKYRFRYYADSKAHKSDDKKTWYSGTGDDAAKMREALEAVFPALGLPVEFVDLAGATTGLEMMERLAKTEWAHIRAEGSA